jgi:hypothetical protein
LGESFIHLPHEADGELHAVVLDALFEQEIKSSFGITRVFPKINIFQ